MGEDAGGSSEDYDPNADPNADPHERRRIRYEYRELISDTQRNRHDFIKPQSTGLHKALDIAEKLFSGVRQTREAVLDSNFLTVASSIGAQQAQQLQTHLMTFDHDVFVEKLITFMGGRNLADTSREGDDDDEMPTRRQRTPAAKLDWKKLGQKACVSFRRAPTVDFMLGPLTMEIPVKGPPKRNGNARKPDRPDPSQKVMPSQVEKVEAQEEATTKEVDRIHKVLYDNTVSEDEDQEITPVCLFKFIINPHSFGQTVENLFHLSFLVRDGRANISLDDSGLPVVSIEDMPGEDEQPRKQQVVAHLTLGEFQEIIKTFNITKPMIPRRNDLNQGPGNHGNQNNEDDDDNDMDEDS